MKILRYFIAAVLVLGVLGVTGVANAITFKVLDPSGGEGPLPELNFNGSNTFSFYTCTVFPNEDGCFGAYNSTGETQPLSSFSASITALPGVDLGTADCPTGTSDGHDSAFSIEVTCTVSYDPTTNEDTLTVFLTGGSGIAPGNNLWIVDSDVDPADFAAGAGTFTITTATPEPSSLLLALSGMGPLGYLVRRRRKNTAL